MPDDSVSKILRPNDLCSAAFYGDVKKLAELLTVPVVEEEPPLDAEFDPSQPADEEAAAALLDRSKQRADNVALLQKRVGTLSTIRTRVSLVNQKDFGFFVALTEVGDSGSCSCKFKSSSKCLTPAAPLHWAVLGREHDAIDFLIQQGADENQKVPGLGVDIFDICSSNDSLQTIKVVKQSVSKRDSARAAAQDKIDKRNALVQQRADARIAFKQKEEDDRLAAERAAIADSEPIPEEVPDTTGVGDE